MKFCHIESREEQAEFTLRLIPFITDWQTAPPKFFAGLASRFRDLRMIEPTDFSQSSSGSLADVWCRCRLFNGAATVTLKAGEVALRFDRVHRQVHAIIYEMIRRTLDLMASELPDHEHETSFFSLSQNAAVLGDVSADSYLAQFPRVGKAIGMALDSDLTYQPSVRVSFSNEQCTMNRVVEKSTSVEGGLFVHTNIVLVPAERSPEDIETLLKELVEYCDIAVGLTWD